MADPLVAFTARRQAIHMRLLEALARLFLGLDSWRTPDLFVAQAMPLVRGSQTALIALVDAYMAALLSRDLGVPVRPAGIDPGPIIAAVRGEVTPGQVYARPFDEVWSALAYDRPLDEAVQLGVTRAREVAEADLQITYSHAVREAMRKSPAAQRITGWRRVLKGESSCALCVIASTQRYTVEQLKAIHPGCDCEVKAITGKDRHVIDRKLLDKATKAAATLISGHPTRDQLKDILLTITREHGEHGPILVDPRHRFTGKGEQTAA